MQYFKYYIYITWNIIRADKKTSKDPPLTSSKNQASTNSNKIMTSDIDTEEHTRKPRIQKTSDTRVDLTTKLFQKFLSLFKSNYSISICSLGKFGNFYIIFFVCHLDYFSTTIFINWHARQDHIATLSFSLGQVLTKDAIWLADGAI